MEIFSENPEILGPLWSKAQHTSGKLRLPAGIRMYRIILMNGRKCILGTKELFRRMVTAANFFTHQGLLTINVHLVRWLDTNSFSLRVSSFKILKVLLYFLWWTQDLRWGYSKGDAYLWQKLWKIRYIADNELLNWMGSAAVISSQHFLFLKFLSSPVTSVFWACDTNEINYRYH